MVKKAICAIELLLVFVAICSFSYIVFYYYQSFSSKEEIEEIREQIPEIAEDDREDNGMLKAYSNLYKQNNDFSGWLKIDGTSIDYPVMQAKDNDFYMNKDFDKKYRYSGLPFADYQCNLYRTSTNIIIYAHNMRDGSMFATLEHYKNKEFYENNKRITFNTLYEKGEYEVIGALYTTPDKFNYHSFINTKSKVEFNTFIADVDRLKLYETSASVEFGDYLLTLSTCSYNSKNERFVVVAKRIN